MPENNNKKKGSKKQQENVSINVEGQEEQALRNHDQEKSNEKEPEGKGQEKGRAGGILGKIWNALEQTPIVGLLFKAMGEVLNTLFGTSGQEQSGDRDKKYKEDPIQPESVRQGEWLNSLVNQEKEQDKKHPKDLDQKEIQKAGEGLKEVVKRDNGSDRPIDGMAPNHTPGEAKQEKDGPQVGG
ncbi:hypothetical protein [Wolbachia endosymbiont (group E) of Neria commutata]|uniref:hypothetical protein n=1 Tax=Wolbachia endosymbiont (group E) of Neria commutata TaxID=3066149 RepID=UPI003132DFFF